MPLHQIESGYPRFLSLGRASPQECINSARDMEHFHSRVGDFNPCDTSPSRSVAAQPSCCRALLSESPNALPCRRHCTVALEKAYLSTWRCVRASKRAKFSPTAETLSVMCVEALVYSTPSGRTTADARKFAQQAEKVKVTST